MKKLFKVLILTFLCQQAFTQSSFSFLPNEIVANKAIVIDNNGSNTIIFRTGINLSSSIFYRMGDLHVGSLVRSGHSMEINFRDGWAFNTGRNNFNYRTTIDSTGVSVTGKLKSSDLSFTTTNNAQLRPVFANKDGVLKVDNSATLYQSYNFTAVQTQNWDDQLQKGSGFAWFNTTNAPKTMYLPVNLPDGVEITLVSMTYVDNSASSIDFIMYANNNNNNAFTTISSGTSILASSGIRTSATVANAIVDNNVNSYYVNITSVGNWTGGTLQFHSLVISYRYR
jgi:hypothetical protein